METGAELPSGPEREAAAGRFGDSVKEASGRASLDPYWSDAPSEAEAQTWTGVSGSGLDPSGLKWSSSVVQLNGDSKSCGESTASEEDQEHLEKEDSLAQTFSSIEQLALTANVSHGQTDDEDSGEGV